MNKTLLASLLAMPLALAQTAALANPEYPTWSFSGYGTAALTASSTDQAQFARPNQSSGASRRPVTGVDSNLGLQGVVQANEWLSATVQALVRKDGDEGFEGELAWAFAKAKLGEHLSVRVGRIGLPVFMISDYRNVGYANTLLRPPGEVYSQISFGNVDGVDATYQHSVGGVNLSAQLALGKTRAESSSGPDTVVHIDAKKIVAVNLVAERGPLTLRFGHATSQISVTDSSGLNSVINGLRAVGAGYRFDALGQLADRLQVIDKKGTFTSLGLMLDWNDIVLQSEYARRRLDAYNAPTNSWYAMAGYRYGKVLPYYSHSELSVAGRMLNTVPQACPPGFPAACTPTLRQLSAGVNALINQQGEQSTDTIGVRWDFHRAAALKVQIDRVRPKGSPVSLIQQAPGFRGPVTVGAVAVDFVF